MFGFAVTFVFATTFFIEGVEDLFLVLDVMSTILHAVVNRAPP
jgi:hypothetical protein